MNSITISILLLTTALVWTHSATVPPVAYQVIDMGVAKPSDEFLKTQRSILIQMFVNGGIDIVDGVTFTTTTPSPINSTSTTDTRGKLHSNMDPIIQSLNTTNTNQTSGT